MTVITASAPNVPAAQPKRRLFLLLCMGAWSVALALLQPVAARHVAPHAAAKGTPWPHACGEPAGQRLCRRTRKHERARLLQRQQQRDEERFVANFRKEDEQQRLHKTLPAGNRQGASAGAGGEGEQLRRATAALGQAGPGLAGPRCRQQYMCEQAARLGSSGPCRTGAGPHRTGSSPTSPGMKAPACCTSNSSLAAAGCAASRPPSPSAAAAAYAAQLLGAGRQSCGTAAAPCE